MEMELVLLCILNVVLLALLLFAFKLIRSGGTRAPAKTETETPISDADIGREVIPNAEEPVIDLRDNAQPPAPVAPAAAPIAPAAPITAAAPTVAAPPAMPVYTSPEFSDDGTPLPDSAFEPVDRNVPSQAFAPLPPTAPGSMEGVSRSSIVIDSSLNGSGPTPSELLFSVIETLGGIGFQLTKDSPNYGLLKDIDDNTASVDLTKRHDGTDRISLAVDSPRAVETLAVLEIWHRSRLGATEQVRLSARIR